MTPRPDRRTAVDIAAAVGRHAATAAAGLVVVAAVARRLGAEGLGAWALLGTASYLLALADLGLTVAVQRAALDPSPARARRAAALALAALAALGPLAALASYPLVLAVPGAPPALAADLARAAPLALAGGLVGSVAGPFRGFALVRGGMLALARARVLAALATVGATLGGLALAPSLVAPALGLLAGGAVETALSVRAARALDPGFPLLPGLPGDRAEVRAALRDGAAALAINLAVVASLRVNVFVLGHVAPLAVVAAFSVAARAVDQSSTLARQAAAALLPRVGDPATRAATVRLGTALLGGLMASGMAALALDGRGLLVAWAGPVAASDVTALALALLAVAAVLAAAHEVAVQALTLGAASAWTGAAPQVAGAAVALAVAVAGAPAAGVWAVAGGAVAGNAVSLVLAWRRARALLAWSRWAVARVLAPVLAGGAAASGAGLALAGFAATSALASAAACVAATGAGCGAAALVAWGRP